MPRGDSRGTSGGDTVPSASPANSLRDAFATAGADTLWNADGQGQPNGHSVADRYSDPHPGASMTPDPGNTPNHRSQRYTDPRH